MDEGISLDIFARVVISMGILYIIILAYLIKKDWKDKEEEMERMEK